MGIEFILSAGFWIFKQWFNWFGASEDQKQWLAKASRDLHKRGWAREAYIMELDEKQNSRLEKRVREEMAKEEN